MRRLISPSLPSHKEGDVDVVMLITAALLARGWHGGPAERLMLGHCPVGLKWSGSFKGVSLLAKTGFQCDFNPQVLGTPLYYLHDLTLPTGRGVDCYPALCLPRGHREMR